MCVGKVPKFYCFFFKIFHRVSLVKYSCTVFSFHALYFSVYS